jgi:hypothetical protein
MLAHKTRGGDPIWRNRESHGLRDTLIVSMEVCLAYMSQLAISVAHHGSNQAICERAAYK